MKAKSIKVDIFLLGLFYKIKIFLFVPISLILNVQNFYVILKASIRSKKDKWGGGGSKTQIFNFDPINQDLIIVL